MISDTVLNINFKQIIFLVFLLNDGHISLIVFFNILLSYLKQTNYIYISHIYIYHIYIYIYMYSTVKSDLVRTSILEYSDFKSSARFGIL